MPMAAAAREPRTLHPCPFRANHPNCQWILEASPTTPGAYYLRSLGGALYLHAHGGATRGANLTLHACPKNADHPNCQWLFEPSPSRQGAFYLRSKGGALYAHIQGGSSVGARGTLHPCPKSSDHPNCQWRLGMAVH
ncbi:MAG: RICIN domain-containing protein [bacterium]